MNTHISRELAERLESVSKALDAKPDDWGLRGIYADMLRDADEWDLAEAQQWMVDKKLRPFGLWIWYGEGDKRWEYIFGQRSVLIRNREYTICLLPDDIHAELKSPSQMGHWRYYATRHEAELALAAALKKLRES